MSVSLMNTGEYRVIFHNRAEGEGMPENYLIEESLQLTTGQYWPVSAKYWDCSLHDVFVLYLYWNTINTSLYNKMQLNFSIRLEEM